MEASGTTSRSFQILSRNIQSLLAEMNRTIQFFPDRNSFLRDYGSFVENRLYHQYSMDDPNHMEIEDNFNNNTNNDIITMDENMGNNNNIKGLFHLKSKKDESSSQQQNNNNNENNNNEYIIYMNICGYDIDLYKLYIEILCRGGFQRVNESNLWNDVLRAILLNEENQTLFNETNQEKLKNIELKLKEYYNLYLYPYECDQRSKYDNIES